MKIGIQVEPVVYNHLVKVELVNQIIESRIKEAIASLVELPNMDDLPFWPTDGVGGIFENENETDGDELSDESQEESEAEELEESSVIEHPDVDGLDDIGGEERLKSILESSTESLQDKSVNESADMLNASSIPDLPTISEDMSVSSIASTSSGQLTLRKRSGSPVKSALRKSSPEKGEPPKQRVRSVSASSGAAATITPYLVSTWSRLSQSAVQYKLDEKLKVALQTAQEYGLDDTARSIAETAKNVGTSVVGYIASKTATPAGSPEKNRDGEERNLFELFGVSISTSPVMSPDGSPRKRNLRRRSMRNLSTSSIIEEGSYPPSRRPSVDQYGGLNRRSVSLSVLEKTSKAGSTVELGGEDGCKSVDVLMNADERSGLPPRIPEQGESTSVSTLSRESQGSNEVVGNEIVERNESPASEIQTKSERPVQEDLKSSSASISSSKSESHLPRPSPTLSRLHLVNSEDSGSNESTANVLLGLFSQIRQRSLPTLFGYVGSAESVEGDEKTDL